MTPEDKKWVEEVKTNPLYPGDTDQERLISIIEKQERMLERVKEFFKQDATYGDPYGGEKKSLLSELEEMEK